MQRWTLMLAMAGAAALGAGGGPALAQETQIDTGNTAWMLTSTALVLMMTVPGLALFYAGMVRKMNALATAMQSFATCCLVTVLWMVVGYSPAFAEGGGVIGGLGRAFLGGMTTDAPPPLAPRLPESVFLTFPLPFALIPPPLL